MTPASLTLTFLPADTRWGLPDPGYLPCSDQSSSAGSSRICSPAAPVSPLSLVSALSPCPPSLAQSRAGFIFRFNA